MLASVGPTPNSTPLWTAIEGYIFSASGDDDYFGYAVGFLPGDTANPGAEYYLVDWKRGTQYANFIDACTPGSTAYRQRMNFGAM